MNVRDHGLPLVAGFAGMNVFFALHLDSGIVQSFTADAAVFSALMFFAVLENVS